MQGFESCTAVFLAWHFLFTSSDAFTIGFIVQPEHTAKNRTAEISASGIADILGTEARGALIENIVKTTVLYKSSEHHCFGILAGDVDGRP